MPGSEFCNTHAPRPHDEFICHGTGERRQNIINEIKRLLDKADDRPCVIPKIRPDNKMRPIMNYPGFVDKRHPVFQPPEPPPLITYVPVQEVRQTSEPGRVADDPPNMCYKVRQFRQKKPEKDRDLLFRLHDIEMDLGSDTSLRQIRSEPQQQGETVIECCCYKIRCQPKKHTSGKDRDLLFRLHQNDLSLGSDTTLRKGSGKQNQHHGGTMAMKGGGKEIELRGGQMISTCECVRRNGLQDQCPRRECGGRPECTAVNPGPCCEPAMAMRTKDMRPVEMPLPQKAELCQTNKGIAVCCCCHKC